MSIPATLWSVMLYLDHCCDDSAWSAHKMVFRTLNLPIASTRFNVPIYSRNLRLHLVPNLPRPCLPCVYSLFGFLEQSDTLRPYQRLAVRLNPLLRRGMSPVPPILAPYMTRRAGINWIFPGTCRTGTARCRAAGLEMMEALAATPR